MQRTYRITKSWRGEPGGPGPHNANDLIVMEEDMAGFALETGNVEPARAEEIVRAKATEQAIRNLHAPKATSVPELLHAIKAKDREWLNRLKAALNEESSGVAGGYLVEPEVAEPYLAPLDDLSIMRWFGATCYGIRGLSQLAPTPDMTTARTAGTPPYWGGFVQASTLEGKVIPDAAPAMKAVELKKTAHTAAVTVSNPLFDDAPALDVFLKRSIPPAVAWYENFLFCQGGGPAAGQPQGVIGSPASVTVNRYSPNSVAAVDLQAMLGALVPGDNRHAFFAANPGAVAKILGITGWVPNGPLEYAGIPIVPTDALPALGTAGDVICCRADWYVIGDDVRPGGRIEVAASAHLDFTKNQTVIRILRRLDGRPVLDKPITAGDGVTQVSPFVVLV